MKSSKGWIFRRKYVATLRYEYSDAVQQRFFYTRKCALRWTLLKWNKYCNSSISSRVKEV